MGAERTQSAQQSIKQWDDDERSEVEADAEVGIGTGMGTGWGGSSADEPVVDGLIPAVLNVGSQAMKQ